MSDDNRTHEQRVDDTVQEFLRRWRAEYDTPTRPPTLTPEEEIQQRLTAARFRERLGEHALAAGVRPAAIRHVVRDAQEVFELRGSEFVPRRGQTEPGDPLVPLSPARWLEQLRRAEPFLFVQR